MSVCALNLTVNLGHFPYHCVWASPLQCEVVVLHR